jgi:uncharacterized membrane protein YdcZ (DUF606 family)
MLVDHFGWFGAAVHPISGVRLLGLAALLFGAYCVTR